MEFHFYICQTWIFTFHECSAQLHWCVTVSKVHVCWDSCRGRTDLDICSSQCLRFHYSPAERSQWSPNPEKAQYGRHLHGGAQASGQAEKHGQDVSQPPGMSHMDFPCPFLIITVCINPACTVTHVMALSVCCLRRVLGVWPLSTGWGTSMSTSWPVRGSTPCEWSWRTGRATRPSPCMTASRSAVRNRITGKAAAFVRVGVVRLTHLMIEKGWDRDQHVKIMETRGNGDFSFTSLMRLDVKYFCSKFLWTWMKESMSVDLWLLIFNISS